MTSVSEEVRKVWPCCSELSPEFDEVINLAVEDHRHRLVFVGHGLAPAGQIDDAQAPEAQSQTVVHKEALIIGPAVA